MYKMINCLQVLANIAEQAKTSKELAEKLTQLSNTSQAMAELDQQLKKLFLKPLSPGFTKRYKLGRVLGEGGFGFVMTATRVKDGRKVAVKFIDTSKTQRSTWLPDATSLTGGTVPPEISILQQLDHPNIIQYIDHVVEPTKYVLLITELHGSDWKRAPGSSTTLGENVVATCASFDLFECIDHSLPEPVARRIFAQIALAVNHLQVKGLVHRDLKDENIVVDSNYNIRIIDFGSAAPIPKSQRAFFAQFQGTALYASPEIVRKEKYRGPEAEMWALGVLLYTMIFGGGPFHSDDEILEGTVRMPRGFHLEFDKDYNGGCQNLIQRLLEYDPESRITIEEVLHHPWLKSEVDFLHNA
ncbi:kinase-like domain-containing protein [Chytriomyces cf. hyalinus JEL632]|nr:kinase-like domain-containing protein [Chytriomyces cf. hyalinus JEL632]